MVYDFIKYHIPLNCGDFERIANLSNTRTERILKRSGEIEYSFTLRNLQFYMNPMWLNVKGSMSRFHQGHNIVPLSSKELKDSFSCLSDSLGVDVSNSRVSGYELSTSFIMNHHVGCYLDMMRTRMRKDPVYENDGTLKYGSAPQIVFYDKKKQLLSCRKKILIPEEFQNKNLLRYEVRKMKGVEERWSRKNKKEMLVDDLYDEKELQKQLKEYHKQYKKVQSISHRNGVYMSELDRKVKEFVNGYMDF